MYLFSVQYPGDPVTITQACYDLKNNDPVGVEKSNQGGWQSQLFSIDKGPECLQHLSQYVLEVSNTTLLKLYNKQENTLKTCDWWVNINTKNNFNAPHTHGDIHFIAIYYPQLCASPGELALFTPFNCSTKFGQTYKLMPEENRIYFLPGPLLHCVYPSQTDEKDRISVAFNID